MIINMGPQHPSTHGVLRLLLELDGETVITCKPIIGYLHTGIEKNTEYRTWMQGITYVTRADYLSPVLQRARLLPGGRAPARDRGAAARAGDPRPLLRAEPDLLAPGVARDGRARAGRGERHAVRLPRARGPDGHVRVGHRAADEPRLHPDRRRDHGHPRGGHGQDPRVPPGDAGADRRDRVAAVGEPDLGGAQSRRGGAVRGRRPGVRGHGPDAAGRRRGRGPAQGHAVRRVRDLRLRRAGPHRGRLLRALHHPAGRDARVDADRRAVPRAARGAGSGDGRGPEGRAGPRSSRSVPTASATPTPTSITSWRSRWRR